MVAKAPSLIARGADHPGTWPSCRKDPTASPVGWVLLAVSAGLGERPGAGVGASSLGCGLRRRGGAFPQQWKGVRREAGEGLRLGMDSPKNCLWMELRGTISSWGADEGRLPGHG